MNTIATKFYGLHKNISIFNCIIILINNKKKTCYISFNTKATAWVNDTKCTKVKSDCEKKKNQQTTTTYLCQTVAGHWKYCC